MSKLILAAKCNVEEALRRGTRGGVPHDNRKLMTAQILLQDLVALTWKLDLVFANGNCFEMTSQAAKLLHVSDELIVACQKAQDRRFDRSPYACSAEAYPGDWIVLLPLAGTHSAPKRDDKSSMRSFFLNNRITVAFVGSQLPADVAKVFEKVTWNLVDVSSMSLADRITQAPRQTVSIFEAIEFGLCVSGVEAFQKRYFPKRSEVDMSELIPYLHNEYVSKLVCNRLGVGDYGDVVTNERVNMAHALGLHQFP